jgi:hypothetical protein
MNKQWQHLDNADKSLVAEKKIRVAFLPAQGSAAALTPQRNGLNGYSNVCIFSKECRGCWI